MSLDGDKPRHDANRVYQSGKGSFDEIIENVAAIEHRQYVGCAVTITKEPFPLVTTLDELGKYFMTISVKPVRSEALGLDEEGLARWVSEYEQLERRLESDVQKGDIALLFRLLNGDDYFGKFILRSFLNVKALSRCDASCGRIAVAVDGSFYPCPALMRQEYQIGSVDRGFCCSKASAYYERQVKRTSCVNCCFRFACGGECMAESDAPNPIMCRFKQSLILLAMLLEENCRRFNNDVYKQIIDFCLEKKNRNRENVSLREFRLLYPQLTFTEAKCKFDQERPAY